MKNLKRSFSAVCELPSFPDLLQAGFELHQAGRLADAAREYRRALEVQPHDPDALHLLGVATLGLGDPASAVGFLERAQRGMPDSDAVLSNLGNARLATGDASGAIAAYDAALRLAPHNPEILYNRGNARLGAGLSEGIDDLDAALALDPGHLGARFNRANALTAMERFEEALVDYDLVPAEFPGRWKNVGVALARLDRHEEAVAAFERATVVCPDDSGAHNNLGSALDRLGRSEEAIVPLERAVELAPGEVAALLNLARILQRSKRTRAVAVAREAARLAPDQPEAWRTLGDARLAFGDPEGALKAYERATDLDPKAMAGTNNLAIALFREGRLDETLDFYEEALKARPDDADAWGDLGIARLNGGDVEGAIRDLRHSIRLNPANERAGSNLLLSLCYSERSAPEEHLCEAKAWAARHAPSHNSSHLGEGRVGLFSEGKRLRIGYLSADFHAHPAGFLYEAMFPHHDRSRFETFAYSNKDFRDDVTDRIAASVDRWAVVSRDTDEEFAARVRADGIDILVDLLGHTPDHRLKAFALRPAPVQATWLGYFGTTGMDAMDYIVADRYVLPKRHEAHYTERPARLSGGLYAFQPPSLPIEPNALPALANGTVTFGCFNNTAKITSETVALWCEVLRALPGSRMVLNRWPFASSRVRRHFSGLFEGFGVDPSRVEFRATKGRGAYFESYHDVDLMLDTLPFGGGTTTSEALWMGVPVVSLSTERFVGRMTESVLHTVGLPDLLPKDRKEFVRLALALADDLPRLAEMRATLRERVVGSPLCDVPAYTRDLESTFERMWAEKVQGAQDSSCTRIPGFSLDG